MPFVTQAPEDEGERYDPQAQGSLLASRQGSFIHINYVGCFTYASRCTGFYGLIWIYNDLHLIFYIIDTFEKNYINFKTA